jgi:hypothetical protein
MLFKLFALGLVFYYVLFPLMRFLLKGYVITQVHKKMSEQDIRSKQTASKARKEGTIDVDYVPPKSKPKTDDVGGDYVPYEEIKD